jgi:16S rRNA processing protein RimM
MIVLGRISAPYGVKGWVKVHAFGDDPLSWRAMQSWWLAESAETPEAGWQVVRQLECRMHSGALVVHFAGVDDRSGAENLRGKFIGAPREALPKTARGEYYWADLIGLPVTNLEGVALGKVVSLIESGANTVLEVRDEAGVERLLPFTAQVVKKVRVGGVGPEGRGMDVDWGADW